MEFGNYIIHSTNLAPNNSLFLCDVLYGFDIENNIAIAKLDDTEQPLRLSQQLHADLNLLPVFRDVLDCYNILLNIERVLMLRSLIFSSQNGNFSQTFSRKR